MTVRHDGLQVSWLGYATVRVETPGGFVAYLDPGRYGTLTGEWTPLAGEPNGHPPARDYHARDGDLVCVTHDHHYDSDGVERVASEDATVVVYEGVDADRIDRDVIPVADLPYDVRRVDDEARLALDGVDVRSVPAHNEPDGPHSRPDGSVSHPPGFGCGFRLALGGTSVFWPGDTDALPVHEAVETSLLVANIAGSVVMDRHEAADLAEAMDPDLVLPVHYNTIDLLRADSAAFAADVAGRGVPVVLDER
jgi:L-ascorbate metabolism protein UlaG (beta-lactamase superfamily)